MYTAPTPILHYSRPDGYNGHTVVCGLAWCPETLRALEILPGHYHSGTAFSYESEEEMLHYWETKRDQHWGKGRVEICRWPLLARTEKPLDPN